MCGHFSYPTSRRGTRTKQAANALLTRTPQNPPQLTTMSDRHHLQQPGNPLQPRSYRSNIHNIGDLSCRQIRNMNHTNQTRHQTQPLLVWRPPSLNRLILVEKHFVFFLCRWYVAWPCCINLAEDTGRKTTSFERIPFLIHAGGVYTAYAFSSSTKQFGKLNGNCHALFQAGFFMRLVKHHQSTLKAETNQGTLSSRQNNCASYTISSDWFCRLPHKRHCSGRTGALSAPEEEWLLPTLWHRLTCARWCL